MGRGTSLGWTVMLAILLVASPASAGVSDDLADELEGYIETAFAEGDTDAKRAALLTAGLIGGDEQVKRIGNYKSADDASVRLAAGLALWSAEEDDAKSFVIQELNKRDPLFPVLRREVTVVPDERERELLEAVVEKGDDSDRDAVLRYLARQHGTLYDLLGNFVDSDDEATRNAAVEALKSTARKKGLEFVVSSFLESDSESKQLRAVELLSFYSEFPAREQAARKALEEALDVDSEKVRIEAARRLLALNDNDAVDPLVDLMRSTENLARKKEIARLLLDHDVAPPTDPVTSAYKEAKMATMEKPDGASDKEKKEEDAPKIDDELTELYLRLSAATGKSNVFKKLKKMFGTTKFDKRLKAVRALGFVDKSEAVDLLHKALFEGSTDMRKAAAKSLRNVASKRSLSTLKRSLTSEQNNDVKVHVIRALGKIGTKKALRILRFNSRTRDTELRQEVIRAIQETDQKNGFSTLRRFLTSRDLDLRWQAFVAALDVAPKKAMSRIDQVFRDPTEGFTSDLRKVPLERQKLLYRKLLDFDNERVRRSVFQEVLRLGKKGRELLRTSAFDSDVPRDTRRRCLLALSERRHEEVQSRFADTVGDTDVRGLRTLAGLTLAEYADEALEATFRGFVTSDVALVKALGAYGLARLDTVE